MHSTWMDIEMSDMRVGMMGFKCMTRSNFGASAEVVGLEVLEFSLNMTNAGNSFELKDWECQSSIHMLQPFASRQPGHLGEVPYVCRQCGPKRVGRGGIASSHENKRGRLKSWDWRGSHRNFIEVGEDAIGIKVRTP